VVVVFIEKSFHIKKIREILVTLPTDTNEEEEEHGNVREEGARR
jgi:hypothetical protein